MDWEQARFNMIEQQIRPWNVLEQGVLDAFIRVERENFVPPAWREMAFADMEIPLAPDTAMWHPKLEAKILQAAQLQASDKVLDIGSGSGYFAALLAQQAKLVYSVEIRESLAQQARANLHAAGISNVMIDNGDASLGWPKYAPYDVIIVGGSLPDIADGLCEQLNIGGRLLAVIGQSAPMHAVRIIRHTTGFSRQILFETELAPLNNEKKPASFVF